MTNINYKEDILDSMSDKNYTPLTDRELAAHFGTTGKQVGEFISQLDELCEDGLVFKTKKGKYLLPASVGIVVGTLSKHKKGFGFVIPVNKEENDVFVSPDDMNFAMSGDLVAVKVTVTDSLTRKREGVITRILKRVNYEIVGTLQLQKRFGFVIPTDPKQQDDVFVGLEDLNGAQDGDLVVCRIVKWPDRKAKAEGVITEIVSVKGEQGGDIKGLIRQYGLTPAFDPSEVAEAETLAQPVTDEEVTKRVDLRQKTIITIDGADSKDFDDAVSIEKKPDGTFVLGVHIADVSHYVKEGSLLDKEAMKRGNSVYLIDQVIPMLPEVLSNGICSLNPKEDRLTLSVTMEVDRRGKVIGHDIFESVICSTERMVYTDVSDILEHEDKELIEKYRYIYPDLLLMNELASVLTKTRQSRGSLDFDFDEAYITLNEEGIPVSVETAERRIANRIIEEFMLLANETVAEHFYWMEIPFVYRVHEKPSVEKMEEFKRFLMNFGLTLKGNPDSVHPRVLNNIIAQVRGKAEEHVVNTVMLRSMKKAFYGVDCDGHFGLSLQYYCHFTSPIRRYPDLLIHRIIKETLRGDLSSKKIAALAKKTEAASEIASSTERKAQELEREVEKLKKAEYMSYHIGEIYEGIISGVANYGFFVEIENTVEGLVRAADMYDDYYDYEPEKYRLIGRRRRKIYGLGDRVTIQVEGVNLENREVDFILAEES